jgi:aldehyde dehydrogenase family 7 protein A1
MMRRGIAGNMRSLTSAVKLSAPLSSSRAFASQQYQFMADLGLSPDVANKGAFNGKFFASGDMYESLNPSTGEVIGKTQFATVADYEECITAMDAAKPMWAAMPAPARGEVVRRIGESLRKNKTALGELISLEMGKIRAEGLGEVQEGIDICEYAVGLSRSLNGAVIPSERPEHFMMERYNPLKGHVGIISAFNFPCAVFFWNSALSLVCGNTHLWKGHESASLVTMACTKIVADVLAEMDLPGAISSTAQGRGSEVGAAMAKDRRMELVSFTGSTPTGRRLNETISSRFGKTILELGGNNATIVMDDADLALALPGITFSAVGTAGQRCTTLRRLYVQEGVYDKFVHNLSEVYKKVRIGSPLDPKTLCGPLHNQQAVEIFKEGVASSVAQGGKVLVGGEVVPGPGNFVQPTLIEIDSKAQVVQEERFVPITYVMKFKTLKEAIAMNNDVPQGLSSSIFTTNQVSLSFS